MLTLSIVIPVYNEERYLKACLDSIAAQTHAPLEVIVVDNNCTDGSMAIARHYPFVKIVREKRQSQVFAQKTGFKKARGDIIGRIDADALLPPEWAAQVIELFTQDDAAARMAQDAGLEPEPLAAITGSAQAYDAPFNKVASLIFGFYHHFLSEKLAGHTTIWGSNCAVRRRVLAPHMDELLQRPDVWEDYDLSFVLAPLGRIEYYEDLFVENSFRAAHKTFRKQFSYQYRAVRTFYLRKSVPRATIFTICWFSLVLLYPLAAIDAYAQRQREQNLIVEAPEY